MEMELACESYRLLPYGLVSRSQTLPCESLATRDYVRTGVCESLLPDVVAPEAHQNDRSFLHELSMRKFSMVGGYTEHQKL